MCAARDTGVSAGNPALDVKSDHKIIAKHFMQEKLSSNFLRIEFSFDLIELKNQLIESL